MTRVTLSIAILLLAPLAGARADWTIGVTANRIDVEGNAIQAASTWSPLSLSPWAWYKADGNATDSSGNGRNGTFTTPIYTNGVNSQAFYFNNAGYVYYAANSFTGAFTVCFWFRPRVGTQQFICGDATAGAANVSFGVRFGGTAKEFDFLQNNTSVSVSSVNLTGTDWHHVAVVRTGSAGAWNISWYFDGAFDEADVTAVNPAGSAGGKVTVGRLGDYAGLPAKGDIDDMMIFTVALTGPEIAQIYGWRP